MKRLRPLVVSLLMLAGCELPAQMIWSPDGARAAYRVRERAVVIDERGTVVAELGKSLGGFAWSADSSRLYFAAQQAAPAVPTAVRFWTDDEAAAPASPATQPVDQPIAVSVWRDGQIEPLLYLAVDAVWHMKLSPDQNWLAITTWREEEKSCELFAAHLPTRSLYQLSTRCSLGMSFTGPRRLAFVEPRADNGEGIPSGKMVEVTLDEAAEHLARSELFDALPALTPWMQSTSDGILFTAQPRAYPSRPPAPSRQDLYTLYYYCRASRSIVAVAPDVGPLFAASPDWRSVLVETIQPATEALPQRRQLTVMLANGSDARVLRDITGFDPLPMWPAWRGNEQVVFVPPLGPDALRLDSEDRAIFEIVLYEMDGQSKLSASRTLSGAWADDLKPAAKVAPAATQPATQPTASRP